MEEAVCDADVLVMGVPSHGFRETLEQVATCLRPWVPIVSLTKGLEQGTRLRMSQVVHEVLPGHPVAVLTGPNLAKEILAGQAAAAVVAMADDFIASALQQIFATNLFRVYSNRDVDRIRARRRHEERDRHRVGHGRRGGRRRQHPCRGHDPRPGGDDPSRRRAWAASR